MKVILAETAGFCFGVKRAVETVYRQVEENPDKKIYTFGPIIHNDEVIKDMQAKGVTVLRGEEDLPSAQGGIVIIRSHGVPKRVCDKMDELGIQYVDATCPFVKKIHRIAMEKEKESRFLVVIGNPAHPEVEGIMGWAGKYAAVIANAEEADALQVPEGMGVCVVAQTTFNYNKFKELVEIISKKRYDIIVLNTICNATEERQTEASNLAKVSDAMIVIGGRHSSNTQKLFEISKKECENTYYIQTLSDLDLNSLKSARNVGITAGASTPNTIIQEVYDNVRRIKL